MSRYTTTRSPRCAGQRRRGGVAERALAQGLTVLGPAGAPRLDLFGDRTVCHTVRATGLVAGSGNALDGPRPRSADHVAYCLPSSRGAGGRLRAGTWTPLTDLLRTHPARGCHRLWRNNLRALFEALQATMNENV
jgi:hypothetical protein